VNGILVGVVLAVALAAVWALVTLSKRARGGIASAASHDMLIQFGEQSLELASVRDVLGFAGEAAAVIFGATRSVSFEPGAVEAQWEAAVAGGEPLGEVPATLRGVFGWVKHNPGAAHVSELGGARFGALRTPLRQLMTQYDVDLLVPLVDNGQVLGTLGVKLGKHGAAVDRDLLRLFQSQITTACGNVRLHGEAAHSISLAREVTLASAIHDALVASTRVGAAGRLRWAGDIEVAGEAGSDFWSVYPLSDGRVVMVVGDAVGAGLAGSMASAVVKSCCDALIEGGAAARDAAVLLGDLSRALYRPSAPVHTRCFAVVFDPQAGVVRYANAGHSVPYHLRADGSLGVLAGTGPLLGDAEHTEYRGSEVPLQRGDTFVLFTDGLVKSEGAGGKPFGERRLQKLLADARGQNPAALRRTIVDAVREHRGDRPLRDDAAVIVVEVGA
jgi:sigma-B regulation protein RsbU (phosphoserine phosphatase)